MRISGDITTLRRLHPTDKDTFLAYRNDPDVARYQNWPQLSDKAATGFLYHMQSVTPLLRPGHWAQIAVADATTDHLIGDMGLFLSQDGTEAEIGITLQSASQCQGHAFRAMQMAMTYLFNTTNITRIIAGADARNTRSLALIHRLPFVETDQTWVDGLLEINFESRRA